MNQVSAPTREEVMHFAALYIAQRWPVFLCHGINPHALLCRCRHGKDCDRPGKHPIPPRGLLEATLDLREIEEGLKQRPGSNLAFATGAVSGVLLLDVEEEALDQQAGFLAGLPPTIEWESGGGGRHLLFGYPAEGEWGNKQGILPKVDIRGAGGYAMAPPSLHVSGRRYQEDGLFSPGEHPLAPAPEELLALIRARNVHRPASHPPGGRPFPPTRVEPILEGCAAFRKSVVDAATLGEPSWKMQSDLCVRVVDGKEFFQRISKPHPSYKPEATDRKFNYSQKSPGPPTCAWIRAELPEGSECATCPHWGQIRSPIVLGMPRPPRLEPPPSPGDEHAPAGGSGAPAVSAGAPEPDQKQDLSEAVRAVLLEAQGDPSSVFRRSHLELLADLREMDLPAFSRTLDGLKNLAGFNQLGMLKAELTKIANERKRQALAAQMSAGGGDTREKAGKLVYELVFGAAKELFKDANAEGYATVANGARLETLALGSKAFLEWASQAFYSEHGDVPSGRAIKDAVATLTGWIHEQNEPAREVFTRIGTHGGALYLNLANEAGQSVRITPKGWEIVTNPPAKFVRTKGLLPLPVPVRGGNIEELRPFTNVAADGDFRLLVSWLLACFRTQGPFPLLELTGGQGTAKSTQARVLQRLIDPQVANLRSEPKETRDLAIAARNGWLIAYDNLRHFEPWLSDTLCRLSTGGGFAARLLFSDYDEAIFAFQRPALWTGVTPVAGAADLLDRTITLRLLPLKQRKEEAKLWAEFDLAAPRILGALLDAVSCALRRLQDVTLPNPPRLADFAVWATAAEPALGWEDGGFMTAFASAREEAHSTALEACPISTPLLRFVAGQPARAWEGTAEALLESLLTMEATRRANRGEQGESTPMPRNWPATPRGMTAALQRSAPILAEAGLTCEQLPRKEFGRPWRLTLTNDSEDPNPPDGSPDGQYSEHPQPSGRIWQPSGVHTHVAGGPDGSDGLPATPCVLQQNHTSYPENSLKGNEEYKNHRPRVVQNTRVLELPGRPSEPSGPPFEGNGSCPGCGQPLDEGEEIHVWCEVAKAPL